MKKTTIIALLVLTLVLSACSAQPTKITDLSELEGKVVAIMSTPQDPSALQEALELSMGIKMKELQVFDTYAAAVAALKSGHVDAVFNVDIVADFYTKRDSDFTFHPYSLPGTSTIHMALRTTDTELLEEVNAALISLRDDGTLAQLQSEWIDNLTPEKQLVGKDLPVIPDAPTLNVGVSGDLPPLDYVAADGKPAGYNVELLSRLSEILGVNFEVLVLPTDSKFPSLASHKIDLFFFHMANADLEIVNKTLEANSDSVLTEAYYTVSGLAALVMK